MSMENRVALITGATGGLGRIVTREFAAANARLALFSRSEERLKQLVDGLGLEPGRVVTAPVDLGDSDSLHAGIRTVLEKFARLDILLHLVGGWSGGKNVLETPIEDVSTMLNQHLWTTMNLVQAALPHLLEGNWGRVIVVSSPTATRPRARTLPYAVGKAAQETLMITLAEELKGTGVTANVVQVKTIDVEHQREREPTPKNAFWTTPEEITSAILYLCSDEARMVNGARIPMFASYR